MDSFYRPTWVEISLDALEHNIKAFRGILPAGMKLMAVVKANAYGHGGKEVAEEAVRCGADYLGVAFLDEAMELRQAGIAAPILVLGHTPPDCLRAAYERDIAVTVFSDEALDELERAAADYIRPGKPLKAHVKIDTGMGRIGLHDHDAAIRFIGRLAGIRGVEVEGLFTHYAKADETDKTYTHEQARRFERIVNHCRAMNWQFPLLHAGNSATGIEFPRYSYNMLRLGISLYGLHPSAATSREAVHLRPVMSYKTRPVMVKTLPPGRGISYGSIYATAGTETIATLPVGYGDGYSRMLTGRAEVLIKGRRAKVVGTICMDQCMVNVTEIPGVSLADEVVLFGSQNGAVLPIEELAEALGTIHYEVACMVSNRVPRVYTRDGEIVKIVNRLRG